MLPSDERRSELDETGRVGKAGAGGKSEVAGGRGGGGGGIGEDCGGGGAGGVDARLLRVLGWRLSNVNDDVDETRDATVPASDGVEEPLEVLDFFDGTGGGGSFFNGVATAGTADDGS